VIFLLSILSNNSNVCKCLKKISNQSKKCTARRT